MTCAFCSVRCFPARWRRSGEGILLTVLALNLIGEALADALNPQLVDG